MANGGQRLVLVANAFIVHIPPGHRQCKGEQDGIQQGWIVKISTKDGAEVLEQDRVRNAEHRLRGVSGIAYIHTDMSPGSSYQATKVLTVT